MVPVIRKAPVIAYTRHHRIEGTIALEKGERVTDKLGEAHRQFEVLEGARVYGAGSGELDHEAAWIALNKDLLICLMPAGDGEDA